MSPGLGLYAPQGSTTLLPKLSVTSKVSARTSCAWVGSRVRFRSSEDVTLVRIYFAGWPWVHAPLSEVSLNLKPRKYRLRTLASLPKFPTTLWRIRALVWRKFNTQNHFLQIWSIWQTCQCIVLLPTEHWSDLYDYKATLVLSYLLTKQT